MISSLDPCLVAGEALIISTICEMYMTGPQRRRTNCTDSLATSLDSFRVQLLYLYGRPISLVSHPSSFNPSIALRLEVVLHNLIMHAPQYRATDGNHSTAIKKLSSVT
ncbi:hypothetical protein HBI37_124130 [Parastagonospora nodorum]|nr:hypothetical protein HBI76_003240 [Parastagonospora nodorum]KAH5725985.1 hypothetical protein HBI20_072880 [Parastagonospora nodorum]KAH6237440.1 hypothetical protein HBI53_003670 [Parastagonospora nodorum]KAH6338483.1 hypothetical protein HBI37_124130 [Parastagonospora nodorum]KAH6371825.1 hypothetical protein HBI36_017750 [Parastagonospora nodorum]